MLDRNWLELMTMLDFHFQLWPHTRVPAVNWQLHLEGFLECCGRSSHTVIIILAKNMQWSQKKTAASLKNHGVQLKASLLMSGSEKCLLFLRALHPLPSGLQDIFLPSYKYQRGNSLHTTVAWLLSQISVGERLTKVNHQPPGSQLGGGFRGNLNWQNDGQTWRCLWAAGPQWLQNKCNKIKRNPGGQHDSFCTTTMMWVKIYFSSKTLTYSIQRKQHPNKINVLLEWICQRRMEQNCSVQMWKNQIGIHPHSVSTPIPAIDKIFIGEC